MTKTSDSIGAVRDLGSAHDGGWHRGVVAVCTAHPMVIEAALTEAAATGQVAVIEATGHQVNQDGGYSGLSPDDFRALVLDIAEGLSFPFDRILFGGDHLGPAPWRHDTPENALDRAVEQVRAYVRAGFGKLHLDASTPCSGDPVPLPPGLIAKRAAKLVKAAEDTAKELGLERPVYVIGSDAAPLVLASEAGMVPHPTTPQEAGETLRLHREAFGAQGQEEAFDRVVALVARPGTGFGHADVTPFDAAACAPLSHWRTETGGITLEAQAVDHQGAAALALMVRGGFGILKAGPGLTFALREALYGLDLIAGHYPGYRATALHTAMEAALQSAPANWQPYIGGTAAEQAIQRHYSYADRIRFYWTHPKAVAAVAALFAALDGVDIPPTLISQYLPRVLDAVVAGTVAPTARALAIAHVRAALAPLSAACTAQRPAIRMPTSAAGPMLSLSVGAAAP